MSKIEFSDWLITICIVVFVLGCVYLGVLEKDSWENKPVSNGQSWQNVRTKEDILKTVTGDAGAYACYKLHWPNDGITKWWVDSVSRFEDGPQKKYFYVHGFVTRKSMYSITVLLSGYDSSKVWNLEDILEFKKVEQ